MPHTYILILHACQVLETMGKSSSHKVTVYGPTYHPVTRGGGTHSIRTIAGKAYGRQAIAEAKVKAAHRYDLLKAGKSSSHRDAAVAEC